MALESEGLVRRYPGRGCFVAEITVQDLNEIFALRSLLEVAALRKSYHLIDRSSLDALEHGLEALGPEDPPEAYFATDRLLHELIISNCGNIRLMLILRTLNGQIEQLRRISAMQPQRLRDSRLEHLGIVAALKDQDLDRACALLEEHIGNIQSSTLNVRMQMGLNPGRSAG